MPEIVGVVPRAGSVESLAGIGFTGFVASDLRIENGATWRLRDFFLAAGNW
jgi:hypothetical protein